MEFSLRSYQRETINKMMWARTMDGNDLLSLPQGSGKSVVIAQFAKQINEDVLILQPNRELLCQNVNKLKPYVSDSEIGLYSASVGVKTVSKYTFATIGSIYKKPADFAHFRTVIIDECSLVNPKNLGTMYMKFLKAVGNPKVYGMTATPFRMDVNYDHWGRSKYDIETVHVTKLLNRMKGRFWSRMLHVVHTSDLLEQGYLCPLEYVDMTLVNQDEIPVNKSASDFDLEAYEEIIEPQKQKLLAGLQGILEKHKSVVIFCTSIEQATDLSSYFKKGEVVSSKTKSKDRDGIIQEFRDGKIQAIFNVNILSFGFDHPQIDAVVLIRPTRSMAWYMQALGRGMRIAEGKTKCMVYDFSGTVKVLGRADTMKIKKSEDGWNIETETGTWHNRELYRYKLKKPTVKTERFWG